MKHIVLVLALSICFLIPAITSASTISKEDACASGQDGLFQQSVTINNYSGYSVSVINFYKEKGVLYYVVNAVPLAGAETEAFLWSWNCKTKKPKQLSKHNFNTYKRGGYYAGSAVKIEYADKYHIFLKREFEGGKGENFAPIFSVFYRGDKLVRSQYSLEKYSLEKFKKNILDKKISRLCSQTQGDKGCESEYSSIDAYYPSETGYDFYLDRIYMSGGQVYATVVYKNLNMFLSEATKYSFQLKLDLSSGKVVFSPN